MITNRPKQLAEREWRIAMVKAIVGIAQAFGDAEVARKGRAWLTTMLNSNASAAVISAETEAFLQSLGGFTTRRPNAAVKRQKQAAKPVRATR